jgi:hypothetical protein
MMAQGERSWQVVDSCWVIALFSSIVGDIVDSELPAVSGWKMSF